MVGLCAACAGAVILLLVGTSILDWYWLVVLFAIGAGIGAWRTWRALPSPYLVAQRIDERLGLHDLLSTAFHFGRAPRPGSDPVIIAAQHDRAESIAASVSAASAWPLSLPRQTYPAAALFAVVLALGIFRYGVQGSLDLRTPLITALGEFFWPGEPLRASAKKQPRASGEDPLGIALDQQDPQNRGNETIPDDLLSTVDIPDVNNEGATTYSDKTQKTEVQATAEEGDVSEEGEKGTGDPSSASDTSSQREQGDSKGAPKQSNTPQSGGNENSSLMDKMRDAMANLLSKLKIPQQSTQTTQAASKQGGQQDRESKSGRKSDQSSGKQEGKGSPSDDADSGEQSEAQQQQAAQGKSSDAAGDSPSKDPNSGIGKQDGSKEIRDAEQQTAMGKLSEIYGKRAQNVTGEIMIEVAGGKQQQLRTAYSNRGATHREAGSEMHRDEVPLVYQHYVQQYFEKVRKPEATPPAATSRSAPSETGSKRNN
jgi:hypothetical protein